MDLPKAKDGWLGAGSGLCACSLAEVELCAQAAVAHQVMYRWLERSYRVVGLP